ncbi:hypothetical protein INT46_008095 [Mucor plumbeus]|uniref:Retrotransposon gag domain-containing protein n=1 Tax=Mucor plumbeus TaxID=97098 RepID=A0A8H7RK48_9FUNG|nr:hypothetical protein INT46_008095 [Mucor plumbeus]
MEVDSNNLELPLPATVTGSGSTLSKANVDKLQSTVNQLTIDTTLASAKFSTLTGAARCAAVLELEDLTKTLRMSMELLSQLCASLPSSPTSYKIPMYSQNKIICPANLPYFQWEGAVFDNKNTIFVDVHACLTKFEDVMYSYSLNFTNEYPRLLPPMLPPTQRTWYKSFQSTTKKPSWGEFKAAFKARYGLSVLDDRQKCVSDLMDIGLKLGESLGSFVDRFNDLGRRAYNQVPPKFLMVS